VYVFEKHSVTSFKIVFYSDITLYKTVVQVTFHSVVASMDECRVHLCSSQLLIQNTLYEIAVNYSALNLGKINSPSTVTVTVTQYKIAVYNALLGHCIE
jgi:hypothetical protein